MSTYTKLFIQTFGMLFVALAVGGYFYFSAIGELYEEKVKLKISNDNEIVLAHFKKLESQVTKLAYDLSTNQAVTQAIYTTASKDQQQSIEAKKRLLNLSDSIVYQNSYRVSFYDDLGYLVAKNGLDFDTRKRGYVVINNNERFFKEEENLLHDPTLLKLANCQSHIEINFKNDLLGMCFTKEVLQKNTIIGFVKITYIFTLQDLKELNKLLHYPIYLDASKDEMIGFKEFGSSQATRIETILYDGIAKLYANHNVDKNDFYQQKGSIIAIFGILSIVLLAISWYIAYTITNNLFLNPLKRLKESIDEIKKDSTFKNSSLVANDELGFIIADFEEMFSKLNRLASANNAYVKSINDTNLVSTTDLKGIILTTNELFEVTSGYKKNELIGKPHNIIRHPDMPKEAFKNLWDTIQNGQVWRGIVKNKTKSGGYYWTDAVITPVSDGSGKVVEYLSIRRDITELIEQKQKLLQMINFDPLTQLGSRDKLDNDLKFYKKPALALINIDGFSQINDFYGHKFGDKVLRVFASRLQLITQSVSAQAGAYRQNGDEFVVVCDGIDQGEFVHAIEHLLGIIEDESFEIEDENIDLTVSCGISFEANDMIRLTADMALRISKKNKSPYVVYSDENSLNKLYENNIMWAKKLKKAIANDQIIPFFQPIVNNLTSKYEKYEALVRMIGDDGKVISPYFFLEIAKKTKQYIQLTNIMLEKTFDAFGGRTEEFSVNITMEDILNQSINETIIRLLDRYPDIGYRVVFEIVESESIDGNYNDVLAFVEKIKERGCKIAIDDFGSGYSNFEYLIRIQADFIKIDGSLIKDINTKKEAYTVVSVIVSFAKQMGIRTIAEFVEDETTLATLKDLGIDYSQGYYFSKPIQF